jgi:hypothetical protein
LSLKAREVASLRQVEGLEEAWRSWRWAWRLEQLVKRAVSMRDRRRALAWLAFWAAWARGRRRNGATKQQAAQLAVRTGLTRGLRALKTYRRVRGGLCVAQWWRVGKLFTRWLSHQRRAYAGRFYLCRQWRRFNRALQQQCQKRVRGLSAPARVIGYRPPSAVLAKSRRGSQ